MSDLYKVIATLCEQREITVYKMCKDIGIRGSVLSDLKVGRKRGLSADTLSKIADYFGVTVDYLLGDESMKRAHTQEGERSTEDPDIRMIARAGKKMTPEQRENLRKYAQYMYPEAFKDDDT